MKYRFKPARKNDVILVLSAGTWGKGETLEAALKEMGWASVRKSHGYVVFSVHKETFVNDWGATVYPRGHDAIELATYS